MQSFACTIIFIQIKKSEKFVPEISIIKCKGVIGKQAVCKYISNFWLLEEREINC